MHSGEGSPYKEIRNSVSNRIFAIRYQVDRPWQNHETAALGGCARPSYLFCTWGCTLPCHSFAPNSTPGEGPGKDRERPY